MDTINSKIIEWKNWDKNTNTLKEIKELEDTKDYDKLEKILCKRMLFGTAGLRGRMGAGYACMNDLVIIQTSQGLAKYLLSELKDAKERGFVIGYDGRHNSERFAQLTANVFLLLGFRVYLFNRLCPTPLVPFTVVELNAAGGAMVTASHNPKEDNGFKVYWGNGPQIIPPHDSGIQQTIEENLKPMDNVWEICDLANHPKLSNPLEEMCAKYYERLKSSMIDLDMNAQSPINFTLSSMHGVSHTYMVDAFKHCGFKPFIPVKEQMEPDPEFPTVKFPNPEEGDSALDLSFKTAEENDCSIILANDPDADRLAVCEKLSDGSWRVFTGNEIGGLLGWWSWQRTKITTPHVDGSNYFMISSTVSSKIIRAIAHREGFNFQDTLTGFKWMANRACDLMKDGKEVLFAFEEAIGFMNGVQVLDKDGVSAAIRLAELATYLKKDNKSLVDQLGCIYQKYGYHICSNSYFICHEAPVIKKIFDRIRKFSENTYPSSIKDYKIKSVRDLKTGYDSGEPDGVAVLPTSSSSEMITLTFVNGAVVTLRTSGTEPKIKYYSEMCGQPGEGNHTVLKKELEDLIQVVIKELLQPKENNLIYKS